MKRTILIGIIVIFTIACEEDNDLIECQLRSGEYMVFHKNEIYNCNDKDGDGIAWLDDCNDLDERVGGSELAGDFIDNDCDGKVDESHNPWEEK